MSENVNAGTLRNAIPEMQRLHQDVEAQFLLFNRIVPYSHNRYDVYSPTLYSILQGTGPQVISMMHYISLELGHHRKTKQENFPFYYQLLNSNGVLSMQKICAKQNLKRRLAPFQFKGETPKWWQNYNDSKHKLPIGAYHGNIGNVMKSLGALAILHDIGKRILESSEPKEA